MKYKETTTLYTFDVVNMCKRNNLYTCGDSEHYSNMLSHVRRVGNNVKKKDIYEIAKDIFDHSDINNAGYIENVMYLLSKECNRFYEIEE